MPQQVEYARPTAISSIRSDQVGNKLRLAGRLLCYDNTTNLLLLSSGPSLDCVLVDITLCLAPRRTMPFLREEQVQIMVVGHLERMEERLPCPTLPPYSDPPEVDLSLVLRAILLDPVPELDLALWNASIVNHLPK
ncbi:hypothetical protein M407DRAFT_180908 [Tulasnella calospora MUT 4182]|uniref:CST complex subunit Stn1 N-terminal domain-containing protein n=1 Tax=Tulasnella calospora MUT 4182 TaxID=1051891 RepID=A0A0C3QLH4_9AGAM|nr:hypothetical protein M407DRAFT_180908 [Tulasnella calospora MUT 4182]